ncbi:hypothetical protein B0T24DRAFT_589404 [Lasiosphaeria ovina]|uniref:Uncharacterized protein n=1 Tax=Lasiosphaeria ovina TaxID=92902 RepID=A0AAE0JR68_9PEZI|nr:hypothetical protein B0T24DRAFT_600321 [Lasiosphaeria ovina]KAK3378779.1 hypothetical protein B0T24DRAFT_589404 [Lasiosphaeria ovina]
MPGTVERDTRRRVSGGMGLQEKHEIAVAAAAAAAATAAATLRNDCEHGLALTCSTAAWSKAPAKTSGAEQCCACKDRRKFLSLPPRLSSYCASCQSGWEDPVTTDTGATSANATARPWKNKTTKKRTVPAAWMVTEKNMPMNLPEQRGGFSPRQPVTLLFDSGPHYGPPRYGREEPDVVVTPEAVERETSLIRQRSSAAIRRGVLTEKPSPSVSQKPLSPGRALRQRWKDQEGLCVGRQPKFLVPPDLDGRWASRKNSVGIDTKIQLPTTPSK